MSGISLSVVLWEFCLRQEWVDLRFVASDGIVWAQRAVLAARCANWKSLLLDQCQEDVITIQIPDLSKEFLLRDLSLVYLDPSQAQYLPEIIAVRHREKTNIKENDIGSIDMGGETLEDIDAEAPGEIGIDKIPVQDDDSKKACDLVLLQDDEDYADFLENQDDGDVDDPADVLEGSKKATNDRKKVRLPTDMDKLFTDPPDPGEKVMRGPNIHSQCSECQEEFKSEMKLKEHLKESKHSMEYPCDICKKIFRSRITMVTHKKQYHFGLTKESACSCEVCGKTFKTKKNLYCHVLVHYPEKWRFKCDICGLKCMTNRIVSIHKAKEHSVLITCTLCNKSFSSDSNLNAHTKVVHGLYTGANGEAVAPPEFACEFCGLTFKSRTYFGTHLAQHRGETDERIRTCPTCGKEFKGRYYYQHLRLHKPETWRFNCKICNENFITKYKLVEHEAVSHTGEEPFECKECGKRFQTSARRGVHKRYCKGVPYNKEEEENRKLEKEKIKQERIRRKDERLERRRTRHSGGLPRCSDNEDQSLSGKRRGGRRRPLPRPLEYIPDAELGLDQTINITNTTIIVQEGAPVALDALNIATAEIYNPQHHEQEQQQLEDHLQPLDIPDAFKNLPLVLPHDHPVTEEALSPVMGQPIVTSVTLESVAGSESFNAVKVEDILN